MSSFIRGSKPVFAHRLFLSVSILLLVACDKGCTTSNPTSKTKPLISKSQPTPAQESATEGTQTILFFGDSLTAGYGLNQDEAFPALVNERLQSSGRNGWKVVNAGVSGDTSRGGLERTNWVLKAKPDVVFLCLGANDGLRGLELEESQKNLNEIIKILLRSNVQVLLGGMELPANYGSKYRSDFRQMYATLAAENNLPFLPFLLEGMALNPEFTLKDGIHPNVKGSSLIAENVWNFLLSSILNKDL